MAGTPRKPINALQCKHIISYLPAEDAASFVIAAKGKSLLATPPADTLSLAISPQPPFHFLNQYPATRLSRYFADVRRAEHFQANIVRLKELPEAQARNVLATFIAILPRYFSTHPVAWGALAAQQKKLLLDYMRTFSNEAQREEIDPFYQRWIYYSLLLIQLIGLLMGPLYFLSLSAPSPTTHDKRLIISGAVMTVTFAIIQIYGHFIGYKNLFNRFDKHARYYQWLGAAVNDPRIRRIASRGSLHSMCLTMYITYVFDRPNQRRTELLYDICDDRINIDNIRTLTLQEALENISQISNILCTRNLLYNAITPFLIQRQPDQYLETIIRNLAAMSHDPLNKFSQAAEDEIMELPKLFYGVNKSGMQLKFVTSIVCLLTVSALLSYALNIHDLKSTMTIMAAISAPLRMIQGRAIFLDFTYKRKYQSLCHAIRFIGPRYAFCTKARKIAQQFELEHDEHAVRRPLKYILFLSQNLYHLPDENHQPLLPH